MDIANILHKEESYSVVGALFDLYNHIGSGFLEIVYKDALEYDFEMRSIPFTREKEFFESYKDYVLPHEFWADFVVHDKNILEVKPVENLHKKHVSQCLNYLKVSGGILAILANFHKDLLNHRRIIL